SKIELGQHLIAETGCKKETAVMIGDTVHDFEAASAMGIPCILIAAGHNSKKRLQATGVPVVNSLAELCEAFDQLTELF
ncbi:MAG: HAD hydrolase-like protein, partial [Candidatus Riflebacteria bacterium]|nr:HAD hydrolase-like protein [Candidatus Riflebacteria bacterium]